jgi:hypothetical protein
MCWNGAGSQWKAWKTCPVWPVREIHMLAANAYASSGLDAPAGKEFVRVDVVHR